MFPVWMFSLNDYSAYSAYIGPVKKSRGFAYITFENRYVYVCVCMCVCVCVH